MVERTVKVRLEADDRASRKIAGLGKSLIALGAAAAVVAVALKAGRGLVGALTAATKSAGAFELEITRLDQALRNSGQFTQAASADLKEFAKELQKVSVASETQILQATAMALNMGATAETAKEAAQAATNLAASIGVDLETAVRQINKTLGGYAGELGEVIPELKDFTAEQLRAGAGAELINKKFKGAALVLAKTYTGAVNNLETAMEQLRVTIGGPLKDALTVVLNTALIPFVTDLNKAAGETDAWRLLVFSLAKALIALTESMVTAALGALAIKEGLIELYPHNIRD